MHKIRTYATVPQIDDGIMHGDIKPDNILIASDGDVLLCDLGSSDFLQHSLSHGPTGTRGYAGAAVHRAAATWTAADKIKHDHDMVVATMFMCLTTEDGTRPPYLHDLFCHPETHLPDVWQYRRPEAAKPSNYNAIRAAHSAHATVLDNFWSRSHPDRWHAGHPVLPLHSEVRNHEAWLDIFHDLASHVLTLEAALHKLEQLPR